MKSIHLLQVSKSTQPPKSRGASMRKYRSRFTLSISSPLDNKAETGFVVELEVMKNKV